MSGKILAVVGNILQNVRGWFDPPGKGVIRVYIFFLKVKRTETEVIQNSAHVRLCRASLPGNFVCVYVCSGCEALPPEPDSLHILALHILFFVCAKQRKVV